MSSAAEQQQQQQRRDWASTAGMDDYDPLDVDFDDGFDDGDSMVLAAGTVPPGSPVMTASSLQPSSESEDSSSSATAPAAAMPTSASAAAAATVELPPERSERFLEFLADKARKRELCQGRTEYGHLCLQPAEENGYCRYHASQMQSSALVAWDERLFIVLDLDQTLVYTPTDGEEFPLNVRLNIQDITADGIPMKTAIRPFALEMLEQLDAMFTVYVVTGGTPSYCKAIVDLLNRLSRGAREVIKLGVSCRSSMVPVQAQPKTFHLVLPNPADHRLALAIDNCRKAWARECRDQVVIVPDWAPHLLLDEQENLLKQVFERVLQVHERLRKRAFHVATGLALPTVLHVADVLQALYEEEEKARMLRRALTERVDNVVKLMREKVYL